MRTPNFRQSCLPTQGTGRSFAWHKTGKGDQLSNTSERWISGISANRALAVGLPIPGMLTSSFRCFRSFGVLSMWDSMSLSIASICAFKKHSLDSIDDSTDGIWVPDYSLVFSWARRSLSRCNSRVISCSSLDSFESGCHSAGVSL